jgi:hypothetical protein
MLSRRPHLDRGTVVVAGVALEPDELELVRLGRELRRASSSVTSRRTKVCPP